MTMPVDREEQDGYFWNAGIGRWVNKKTGFVRGTEQDIIDIENNRSIKDRFGTMFGALGDIPGRLTNFDTWANPAGDNPTGTLARVGKINTELNPFSKFGNAGRAFTEGDYKKAAWEALKGAGQTVSYASLAGSGAALAGRVPVAGNVLSRGTLGGAFGINAARAGGAGIVPQIIGGLTGGWGGPLGRVLGTASTIGAGLGAYGAFTGPTGAPKPQTSGSVLPGRPQPPAGTPGTGSVGTVMTPEQQQAMADANKNRTDASGSSGPGGGRNYIDWRDWFLSKGQSPEEAARLAKLYVDTNIAWTSEGKAELEAYRNKQTSTGAAPAAPTAPAAPGLLPLSPEQIDMFGQERLAAEKAYEDLLNEQKLQKSQAQQNYTQDVQNYQRYAAGSAADLAGQMMNAEYGTGSSPATAFGIEELVQSPLVSRSLAARKNLDQYLAGLVEKQKQAKAQKDAAMLNIKKQETQARVDNTFNQQLAGYQGLSGR
jgi:hypothetical protein